MDNDVKDYANDRWIGSFQNSKTGIKTLFKTGKKAHKYSNQI